MSEYPSVQVSTQVGSKNITFRAATGDDIRDLVEGFTKNADEVIEGLTSIEQVLLAKGVMSGAIGGPAPAVSFQASSPPPSGDTPTCEHGTWKDLAGKLSKTGQPYKFRYYCPKFGSDCAPTGQWVA